MLETVTPASREAWKKDIDADQGAWASTRSRTWIEWTACEKAEGRYDFSALELLTDLAGEAGLRVIVQVYIDSAPDWVEARHPDSKFVSSNGVVVESQASPGFCFDHAGVQEKILDFFRAAARAVEGKPAFYGWDLWSEPHIINWAEVYYVGDLKSVQFCYCPLDPGPLPGVAQEEVRHGRGPEQGLVPHAPGLGRGRAAALRHHPDLHRLHRLEGVHLRQAGRGPGPQGRGRQVGPARLGRHQPLGRARPLHPAATGRGRPTTARCPTASTSTAPRSTPSTPGPSSPGRRYYRVLGPRLRPLHGYRQRRLLHRRAPGRLRRLRHEDELPRRRHGHARLDVEHGRPRGAGRQHLRLLPDEHGLRGRRLRPGRARRQGHRAGRGGRPDRASGASRPTRTCSSRPCRPRPRSPSSHNPLSHMVGGQQAFTGEGQTVGVNNLSESLQGVHRAFFERNIPVDFLHVRDLGTPRAAGYKLLIAPYPVMMSQPHVDGPGRVRPRRRDALVTEARCGWVDEKGASSPVVPGGGLPEVLGCRETELTPLRQDRASSRSAAADEAFPLLKPGDKLDSLFFEEAFDVFGACEPGRGRRSRTDGRPSWPRPSARAGPSSSAPSSARPTIISRTPTTASSSPGWPIG
ncbi:MAG: beta-galactosidase [Candidatus Moduliflexus flocculans]|nr:beta-galactosidase [Candidatus Moduliflexus flocculans]